MSQFRRSGGQDNVDDNNKEILTDGIYDEVYNWQVYDQREGERKREI